MAALTPVLTRELANRHDAPLSNLTSNSFTAFVSGALPGGVPSRRRRDVAVQAVQSSAKWA